MSGRKITRIFFGEIGLVVGLALVLRVWGIGFGLPYIQHNDEGALIHTAFYMAANKGRPNVYVHGAVMPGLVAFFSGLVYLPGKMMGVFTDTQDFLVWYLKDPSVVVLSGRLMSVFFSLATVLVVYKIGKRFFKRKIGIFAALFLTVSVLHVKESHYVKPDVLAGLISALVFYLILIILKRKLIRYYILVGILIGLGIANKITLVLLVPVILLASFLNRKNKNWVEIRSRWLIFLAMSVVGFFLFTPYAMLNPKFYISEISRWGGTLASSRGYVHSPLWYYFFEYLREGLGILVWVLSILGFFSALTKYKKSKYLIAIVFPVIFLLSTNYWSTEHSQRYILPIISNMVLLAAVGFDLVIGYVSKWLGRKEIIVAFLTLLVVWQPLMRSLKFNKVISSEFTGKLATDWIESNIAEGSKIALEGSLRSYYQPNEGPYLYMEAAKLAELREDITHTGGDAGYFLPAIEKVSEGKRGYQLLATPNLGYKYDPNLEIWNLAEYGQYDDVAGYLDQDVEFLVANNWAHGHIRPWSEEFEKSVNDNFMVIAAFDPSINFRYEPHVVRMDYKALDKVNLLKGDLIFGPEIKIYQKL